MASCGLVNLGSCLPQKFFEYVVGVLNSPIKPLVSFILNLLSEPIELSLFVGLWAIIIYIITMFYALLLLYTGFNFMFSGHDVAKRESAKLWLRNILIMVILVQASYFIYQLSVELSAVITSALLSLLSTNFLLISASNVSDIGLALIFGVLYLITLLITSFLLIIRYAIVSIGLVFFPLAIFFYFIPPLRTYGLLILNFLGVSIFVTIFDAIILIGFSKLLTLGIFSNFKIFVMIAAFAFISLLMVFLLLFSLLKAAFGAYNKISKYVS